MDDTLLTFQKFNDPGLAVTICEQLRAQGIACEVVKEAPMFDISYAFNDFESTTHLKMAPADFNRAHAILEAYYGEQLSHMDPDYYLFSFTDAELREIIRRPDEWGHLDYALAKQLLADRGKPISSEQEVNYKKERLKVLARPEASHPYMTFFGYFFAISGSFLGFILGSIFAYSKKALPNGDRAFIYSPAERRHGKRILILSFIFLPFWLWVLVTP